LIIAVVGICAASIIGVGTLLLSRGQLLGVLPVVLILLSGGVICLRQQYEVSFTTYDVRGVGGLAIAIACAAIVLNGAILYGRRGTGARPGRARSSASRRAQFSRQVARMRSQGLRATPLASPGDDGLGPGCR
jgi:hypothetical protein